MIACYKFAALAVVLGCGCSVAIAQELHLKSKKPGVTGVAMPGGRANQRHLVLQFDHSPNGDDLQALSKLGAKVLSVVPDYGLMVVLPASVSLTTGRLPGSVQWTGPLQSEEKLSSALLPLGWNAVVVEFHPDVDKAEQDLVGAEEGIVFSRNANLRAGHALAYGSYSDLAALASHDEVAYIFPADPALHNTSSTSSNARACAGMLTQNGPVAQYSNIVHGWDLSSDLAAHLSYVFGEMTSKLPNLQTQAEILRAMSDWAKNANITFEPGVAPGITGSSSKTILVRFATGAHGDAYPFDGPAGTLAHTFYPVPVNAEPIAGDIHLDGDENWHIGGDIDLYSVVLHEVGHAIGLGHSDVPGDVMYPYYRTGMKLSANDIGAAQQLYGQVTSGSSSTGSVAPPGTSPQPTLPQPTLPQPTTPPPTSTTPASPAPVPAPALSLNAVPAQVTQPSISFSGALAGGALPVNITWQTDRGTSGTATLSSSGAWQVTDAALVPGVNVFTISAMDAQHRSATQALTVSYNPFVTSSSAPVSVALKAPAGSVVTVTTSTITLAGVASGGSGVVRVSWQTSGGASGTASGTDHWTAADIPLFSGTNTLVVKAWDAAGASSWCTVVVVKH